MLHHAVTKRQRGHQALFGLVDQKGAVGSGAVAAPDQFVLQRDEVALQVGLKALHFGHVALAGAGAQVGRVQRVKGIHLRK